MSPGLRPVLGRLEIVQSDNSHAQDGDSMLNGYQLILPAPANSKNRGFATRPVYFAWKVKPA